MSWFSITHRNLGRTVRGITGRAMKIPLSFSTFCGSSARTNIDIYIFASLFLQQKYVTSPKFLKTVFSSENNVPQKYFNKSKSMLLSILFFLGINKYEEQRNILLLCLSDLWVCSQKQIQKNRCVMSYPTVLNSTSLWYIWCKLNYCPYFYICKLHGSSW